MKFRQRMGLTQNEFATKLGISRQHLSKLEHSPNPLTANIVRRLEEFAKQAGIPNVSSSTGARVIPIRTWAQAGAGSDFGELPLDWANRVATDCPDEHAFAVEIQGDSMEPKFYPGDIAVLMPTRQPRNGCLVVALLEREGVVFKVFAAREMSSGRLCSFTSHNPVFQPIEVPESNVIWKYPVYQVIRQVWRHN